MNLLNPFSFELPTRIEYGLGSRHRLADEITRLGALRVLLVTDGGIVRSGLLASITEQLSGNGLVFDVFDGVSANPKSADVDAAADRAAGFRADCLVAVGGGSPIDCAKAAGVVAVFGGTAGTYEGRGNLPGEPLPLIAIPTTAGSGSEVTFSAVITDTRRKFKFSIKDPRLAPRVALVDPEVTLSLPAPLTAATGMDALTHAIEAYTVKAAEPIADAAALQAVELIATHLKRAVGDGQNIEARAGMLLGSLLAAIAFSHADVGAVHCIAEALGGKYDAPHGVCNAVVLPAVMAYNLDFCAERYARIAAAMGIGFATSAEGARKAVAAVEQLAADVALPDFAELGVNPDDFQELARNSAANGSNPDNPRPMSPADYLVLFKQLAGA